MIATKIISFAYHFALKEKEQSFTKDSPWMRTFVFRFKFKATNKCVDKKITIRNELHWKQTNNQVISEITQTWKKRITIHLHINQNIFNARATNSYANRGTMRNLLPLQLQTIGGIGNYHHQIPIEPGTTPCTVTELSEAECNIDTLKKLKLGMRSSLWSRPNVISVAANSMENGSNLSNNNQLRQPIEPGSNPSDYSIAV